MTREGLRQGGPSRGVDAIAGCLDQRGVWGSRAARFELVVSVSGLMFPGRSHGAALIAERGGSEERCLEGRRAVGRSGHAPAVAGASWGLETSGGTG
jgi:hypothetical protein